MAMVFRYTSAHRLSALFAVLIAACISNVTDLILHVYSYTHAVSARLSPRLQVQTRCVSTFHFVYSYTHAASATVSRAQNMTGERTTRLNSLLV